VGRRHVVTVGVQRFAKGTRAGFTSSRSVGGQVSNQPGFLKRFTVGGRLIARQSNLYRGTGGTKDLAADDPTA
jgi:hypothetical protein